MKTTEEKQAAILAALSERFETLYGYQITQENEQMISNLVVAVCESARSDKEDCFTQSLKKEALVILASM